MIMTTQLFSCRLLLLRFQKKFIEITVKVKIETATSNNRITSIILFIYVCLIYLISIVIILFCFVLLLLLVSNDLLNNQKSRGELGKRQYFGRANEHLGIKIKKIYSVFAACHLYNDDIKQFMVLYTK